MNEGTIFALFIAPVLMGVTGLAVFYITRWQDRRAP